MIENELLNYGIAGLWIAYMIYDKMYVQKKILTALDKHAEAISDLTKYLKRGKINDRRNKYR